MEKQKQMEDNKSCSKCTHSRFLGKNTLKCLKRWVTVFYINEITQANNCDLYALIENEHLPKPKVKKTFKLNQLSEILGRIKPNV